MIKLDNQEFGISRSNALIKRCFDIGVAAILLVILAIPMIVLLIGARFTSGDTGLFRQKRIGLYGEAFTLLKIRSMGKAANITTNVTVSSDPRITTFGKFIRGTKMDEFPQLINVLRGDMSFVGPRPDVEEVYSGLDENQLRVLSVRPGITGPASIRFKAEEELLDASDDPIRYNREVIFPEKIRINLEYIDKYNFLTDLTLMLKTVFSNKSATE